MFCLASEKVNDLSMKLSIKWLKWVKSKICMWATTMVDQADSSTFEYKISHKFFVQLFKKDLAVTKACGGSLSNNDLSQKMLSFSKKRWPTCVFL